MAKVLLLGPAREAAGRRDDVVAGSTVGEVLAAAQDLYGPAFGAVLAVSRVWVNGESADDHTPVGPDDEVAVLPPVSGG